ncbi:MAG: glycosyltransferase [Erysipelotrichaceae bacterium]|nr:glycosyltransferase [Erysipelotrichaceae bacterium]
MPELTIIVPVYNVEKYLNQCLDSLKNQTYRDYEVLIVNDGTKDSSAAIAQTYVEEDPQHFRLLNKENGGLSDARNFAIPLAMGKYITFLDSDDYVEATCYEKMMSKITSESLDIVAGNLQYFYEDSERLMDMRGLNDKVSSDVQKAALLSPLFAWNKVYRKAYFDQIGLLYPKGLWYEDIPVTLPLFANTNRIGHVDEILYHYRQRSGSIMASGGAKQKDIFTVFEKVIAYFSKNNLKDLFHDELEYLCIEHIMLYRQFSFLVSDEYAQLYEQSVQFMEKYYPNYKKNKYIGLLGKKNQLFIHSLSRMTLPLYRHYLLKK